MSSKKESIYDFFVITHDGQKHSLSKYKGNVFLIVNVASKCGFAKRAFESLANLLTIYQRKGFKILLFPCKQFLNQEHSDIEIIKKFVFKYNPNFELMAMTNVVGRNIDPLYRYLCNNTKGFLTSQIKWNFTAFLIDRTGNIVKRYSPTSVISLEDPDLLRCIGDVEYDSTNSIINMNVSVDLDYESDS